jgi:hypothetical protein
MHENREGTGTETQGTLKTRGTGTNSLFNCMGRIVFVPRVFGVSCVSVFSLVLLFCCLLLSGCSSSHQYYQTCEHDEGICCAPVPESDYYIVFLVTARHLDYTDAKTFLKTTAKHPSDGTKNGDVGHAWVYLHGMRDGCDVVMEGGHSGEMGVIKARYWEGVVNNIECGYPNPTAAQRQSPRYEPNPVGYLWETLGDGFFEEGSGGHMPTVAARMALTQEQFEAVAAYMDSSNYDYTQYSLTGRQCSSYVAEIAALLGLQLDHQVILYVSAEITLAGMRLRLWDDSEYSSIQFSSPDVLEESLKAKIEAGEAEDALRWYRCHHQPSFRKQITDAWNATYRLPGRVTRYLLL